MRLPPKYSDVVLNLLVAVAISLVVNFSYLLLLLVEQKGEPRPPRERVVARSGEGVLHISADGHGYLVYPGGDSVYVMQHRIRRLGLEEGDRLVVDIVPRQRTGAHPAMAEIRRRNDRPFDYGMVYNRPSALLELALQLVYYLVVSFVILSILTASRHNYSVKRFVRGCLWGVAAATALYFLAPVTTWPTGRIVPNLMNNRLLDYMLLLKCSFAVVVSMLYAHIYVLISQRQAIVLENERLKNENLTTRYNMLVGQINPHFFFNSLNTLAMLVRERQDEKALTYIDQLSYTFRYIIRNGQSTLIPLGEELKFIEAYGYLFKIRYADKLFFDIEVDASCLGWMLPALSLQPLVGNAVKHNAITRANPLHVRIRTADGWLEVSNRICAKLEAEPSTGIGLENLSNRWRLITGCDIVVRNDGETFTVRMPLQKPAEG